MKALDRRLCMGAAAVLTLLALWWALFRRSPVVDLAETPAPIAVQEATESIDSASSPVPIVPAPLVKPPSPRNVEVTILDLVSGNPMAGVVVSDPATGESTITTDHRGQCEVEVPGTIEPGESRAWTLTLPVHMASAAFTVSWPDDFAPDGDGYVITIPAFAALLVDLPLQSKEEWQYARIDSMHLPPVPNDPSLSKLDLEAYTFSRAQNPGMYPYNLMRKGLIPEVINGRAERLPNQGPWRILIPVDGEVVVQAKMPDLKPETIIARVARGDTHSIAILLKPFSEVKGRLLMDGNPVAGASIVLTVTSRFHDHEPSPQSRGGPWAWATWRKRYESGAWVSAIMKNSTDDQGRFHFCVPYTDKVALCAFQLDAEQSVWRWDLQDRETSLTAELATRTSVTNRRMRLVNGHGAPLPHALLVPRIKDDIHLLQYPSLRADAEGWVIINHLDEGREYGARIDANMRRYTFVAKDGDFIVAEDIQ